MRLVSSWIDLLPSPYNRDPSVVVVMAPHAANCYVHETLGGYHLGVLSIRGGLRGLQVLKPELSTWLECQDAFYQNGMEMADPAYIGRLSEMPERFTMSPDLTPLAFVRDAMWRPMLHLKREVVTLMRKETRLVA